MVRCEQFYRAMAENNGFCKKNPETVKRILKHIPLMNNISAKVAQSEILKDSSRPIGEILSENAARPLHALKNDADLDKALDLIIEKAEQKEMDEQPKIAVTYKEVRQIVNQIIPPKPKTTTRASKDNFDKAKDNIKSAITADGIPNEDITSVIAKIDDLIRTLEAHKSALTQRQATLNARGSNNTIVEQTQPEGAKA